MQQLERISTGMKKPYSSPGRSWIFIFPFSQVNSPIRSFQLHSCAHGNSQDKNLWPVSSFQFKGNASLKSPSTMLPPTHYSHLFSEWRVRGKYLADCPPPFISSTNLTGMRETDSLAKRSTVGPGTAFLPMLWSRVFLVTRESVFHEHLLSKMRTNIFIPYILLSEMLYDWFGHFPWQPALSSFLEMEVKYLTFIP